MNKEKYTCFCHENLYKCPNKKKHDCVCNYHKFKKCKAEIYSFGIDHKPSNLSVIELLKKEGITTEFNIIYSLAQLKAIQFDYILSLSTNANVFIEREFKAPLKFNYNFRIPEKTTKENLEDLRKDIKQYMKHT